MLNVVDFIGINFKSFNKFAVNGTISGLVAKNLQGGRVKFSVIGYGKYLLFSQTHYRAKIVIHRFVITGYLSKQVQI